MRIAGLVCTVGIALAASPGGSGEGYAEARAEAVEELIDEIDAYASWCTGSKLYAERDRAWEVVLRFEPDNVDARKALGHKKDRDGNWIPNERRSPPKDRDPEKLAEAPARWAQAVAPYRDRILELLDERDEEIGPNQRRGALLELLELNPDDPVVRERNGEVQVEGAWVLRETALGAGSRQAMRECVARGFAEAPAPQPIEPDELERSLGIAWTAAWGTPLVRVLTTGDAQEGQRAAQAAHAAGVLFEETCGAPAQYPQPLRFFLLAQPGDETLLFDSHPGIDAATRRFFERVLGAGVPLSGDFCHWSDTPAQRLDGVMRLLLERFMQQAYGLTTDVGWIHEGFGLYLTRTLVGTRLNWFALPAEGSTTAENQAFLAKLYDTSVNWMNEAYVMLQKERAPRFRKFMKKDVTGLTAEELLYSYVIASYLLEGRPQHTPELLRRIGAGEDQAAAVEAVLGTTVDALDERILIWLSQRR